MSLSNPPSKFNLGVIAAKNLDDPEFLDNLLSKNIDRIAHIYTNGANQLVINYARENGIICTIYPINSRCIQWSNSKIMESSDFVFLISNEDSKSTKLAEEECEKEVAKNKRKFSYRVVCFDPVSNIKNKLAKIKEVIDTMKEDEVDQNTHLKAIKKII